MRSSKAAREILVQRPPSLLESIIAALSLSSLRNKRPHFADHLPYDGSTWKNRRQVCRVHVSKQRSQAFTHLVHLVRLRSPTSLSGLAITTTVSTEGLVIIGLALLLTAVPRNNTPLITPSPLPCWPAPLGHWSFPPARSSAPSHVSSHPGKHLSLLHSSSLPPTIGGLLQPDHYTPDTCPPPRRRSPIRPSSLASSTSTNPHHRFPP